MTVVDLGDEVVLQPVSTKSSAGGSAARRTTILDCKLHGTLLFACKKSAGSIGGKCASNLGAARAALCSDGTAERH